VLLIESGQPDRRTRSLVVGVEEDVWLASVDLLTREGHAVWVDHLGQALEQTRRPLARTSWRRLTYYAYRSDDMGAMSVSSFRSACRSSYTPTAIPP